MISIVFIIILFANNITKNTLVLRLGICRKRCHVGRFDFNDTASENFQKTPQPTTTKNQHMNTQEEGKRRNK